MQSKEPMTGQLLLALIPAPCIAAVFFKKKIVNFFFGNLVVVTLIVFCVGKVSVVRGVGVVFGFRWEQQGKKNAREPASPPCR